MAQERDVLVKRVFPQLRRLCDERGVVFGEVDLRWGITDEEAAEGGVLPVCLAEIVRCRPYFIGMLGERYGWVPDVVSQDLVESEPWLEKLEGRSVTELEILHGVLNNPEMTEHGFFYLRDAGYIDTLPASDRDGFRETDPVVRSKLVGLKVRIRESGFPVRENYSDPDVFADMVLEDLTATIDELFPLESRPDPLDRLAFDHEGFLASRTGVYVGRGSYFDQLNAAVDGSGGGVAVFGGSGLGKSALLANWIAKRRVTHTNETIIPHFVGATPQSTEWAGMLHRMIGELDRRFDLGLEIPDDVQDLRVAFAGALHRAAATADAEVVFVFDGVNQLENREGARELLWLPPVIPEGVTVVISTLEGPAQDMLHERGWPSLTVEPLTADERKTLITRFLAQYTKHLSEERTTRIATAEPSHNPLYLRVLLEELRLFGVHEQLDQRIDHYLQAGNPADLYKLVLERFEQDYESHRPDLVKDAMSLLWTARRGLTETELLEILSDTDEPLPQAIWSPLYLAARHSLVDRNGLIGFAHDYLHDAIHDRYIPREDQEAAVRTRLVDYFNNNRYTDRAVDELPYQLTHQQDWDHLVELLTDVRFLPRAWHGDSTDIHALWRRIEKESNHRATVAYEPVLEDPDAFGEDAVSAVSSALLAVRDAEYSIRLQQSLLDRAEASADIDLQLESMDTLAHLSIGTDALAQASRLLDRQEELARSNGRLDAVSAALSKKAIVQFERGNLDEAMLLSREEERISVLLDDAHGTAIAKTGQAKNLAERGDWLGTTALYEEVIPTFRSHANQQELGTALWNLALARYRQRDLQHVLGLLDECERINRDSGAIVAATNAVKLRFLVHLRRGQMAKAGRQVPELWRLIRLRADNLMRQVDKEVNRESGSGDSLAEALGSMASVWVIRGDLDVALELHREEEQIYRGLGNEDGLKESLWNQAAIQSQRGNHGAARDLFAELEQINREVGDPEGLAISLVNQALTYADDGSPKRAVPLAREALSIASKHGLSDLEVRLEQTIRNLTARAADESGAGDTA